MTARLPALSPRTMWVAVAAIFMAAVITAGVFANLKRLALDYDPIDYPFYAQFSAKFFDPRLPKSFTAQPDGYNFLGYHGTEGVYSFNQSLHLEPVKYLYALVFQIGKNPISVYLLIALLYFLPILYLAKIHPPEQARDLEFILLFALLYTLFPAVLVTVTYDLRPRILLGSFFVLAVLSVLYKRPFLEKAVLIGLIFLTREEALVFGAVAIGLNFFSVPTWRRAVLETGILGIFWLAYLAVLRFYFGWAGYPAQAPAGLALSSPYLLVPLALILLTALAGFVLWRKHRLEPRQALQLFVFSTLTLPMSIELRTEVGKWVLTGGNLALIAVQRFVYSEKLSLFFIVALLLVVMLWNLVRDPRQRMGFNVVLGGFAVLFLVLGGLRNAADLQGYLRQDASAAIVFESVQATDPYQTHVLTDEATYQAFYNYRNVTLYTRLPWSMAQENRYFPQDTPYLLKLLPQMDYVVISRASDKDMDALLASANIRFNVVAESDEYRVLKVIR